MRDTNVKFSLHFKRSKSDESLSLWHRESGHLQTQKIMYGAAIRKFSECFNARATEFCQACEEGDLTKINQCIVDGVPLNVSDTNKLPALKLLF
ncbi:hypothetical protein SOPP22_09705 [Shewanella sp. OPT22]|nr:hypothetical protein SOPP22_09705 [Shewanella sp. OPT22]